MKQISRQMKQISSPTICNMLQQHIKRMIVDTRASVSSPGANLSKRIKIFNVPSSPHARRQMSQIVIVHWHACVIYCTRYRTL